MNNKYGQAVISIVNEQKLIIGPLAIDLARRVENIRIDSDVAEIMGDDPLKALEQLVHQYKILFGEASVRVSKEAVKKAQLQPHELPEILR